MSERRRGGRERRSDRTPSGAAAEMSGRRKFQRRACADSEESFSRLRARRLDERRKKKLVGKSEKIKKRLKTHTVRSRARATTKRLQLNPPARTLQDDLAASSEECALRAPIHSRRALLPRRPLNPHHGRRRARRARRGCRRASPRAAPVAPRRPSAAPVRRGRRSRRAGILRLRRGAREPAEPSPGASSADPALAPRGGTARRRARPPATVAVAVAEQPALEPRGDPGDPPAARRGGRGGSGKRRGSAGRGGRRRVGVGVGVGVGVRPRRRSGRSDLRLEAALAQEGTSERANGVSSPPQAAEAAVNQTRRSKLHPLRRRRLRALRDAVPGRHVRGREGGPRHA